MQTININFDFEDMDKLDKLALEAFPPNEYLAPKKIIELSNKGELDFLALYDGATFIGFLVVKVYKQMAYLFFLAIDPLLRSLGYGSKAIKIFKEKYKNYECVLDLEKIDKNSLNFEQRKRRKAFYCRNGFKETNQFIRYNNEDYEVLSLSDKFDLNLFKKMLFAINVNNFHPEFL